MILRVTPRNEAQVEFELPVVGSHVLPGDLMLGMHVALHILPRSQRSGPLRKYKVPDLAVNFGTRPPTLTPLQALSSLTVPRMVRSEARAPILRRLN